MRALALLLAVAAVLAVSGCGDDGGGTKDDVRKGTPAQAAGAAESVEQAFVDVVERVSPSVVQISTSGGLGSGVVYDDQGNVVTNFHVVGQARTFRITLADGTTRKGSLVGSFPPEDLAVVKIEGDAPPAVPFAKSKDVRVGEFALAIGNPLGLRSSVTQGIVSSLGRTVPEGPETGAVLSSAIQTSAPINPGNSGGALADIEGKVIGIPTLAALDPSLGGSRAPGIGFAIASGTAKRYADQLIATGKVEDSGRAYLGVRIASSVGGSGVIVAAVAPGGPAAKAGIRPGDVIVGADGQPTPSSEALATILAEHKPGDKLELDLANQNGEKRSVTVTLGELPPIG
jgi:S1-C subfamily serine protease